MTVLLRLPDGHRPQLFPLDDETRRRPRAWRFEALSGAGLLRGVAAIAASADRAAELIRKLCQAEDGAT